MRARYGKGRGGPERGDREGVARGNLAAGEVRKMEGGRMNPPYPRQLSLYYYLIRGGGGGTSPPPLHSSPAEEPPTLLACLLYGMPRVGQSNKVFY